MRSKLIYATIMGLLLGAATQDLVYGLDGFAIAYGVASIWEDAASILVSRTFRARNVKTAREITDAFNGN
jgi:hypothetical protein